MNLDFDASNSNAVAAAMIWIEATMLGGIATIAAVIAVATFELLLFLGRSAGPAADRSRASELLSFSARRRLHRESCAASMVRQKILRRSRASLLRHRLNQLPTAAGAVLRSERRAGRSRRGTRRAPFNSIRARALRHFA